MRFFRNVRFRERGLQNARAKYGCNADVSWSIVFVRPEMNQRCSITVRTEERSTAGSALDVSFFTPVGVRIP